MTNPIFVVSSAEKSPSGHPNHPINITLCTSLGKGLHYCNGTFNYWIEFEGCMDSFLERAQEWWYPTIEERDADYDRILKAFPATTTGPEPVKNEEVLENVINVSGGCEKLIPQSAAPARNTYSL